MSRPVSLSRTFVAVLLCLWVCASQTASRADGGYLPTAKGPAFPLGFYELPEHDNALKAMAEAGVNLVRCRNRADLDRLQRLGMMGVMPLPLQDGATDALRETIAGLVDHPALALWEGPDEVVWNFTAYSGLFRTMGVHSEKEAWQKQTPEAVAYAEQRASEIIPNMRAAVDLIRKLDPSNHPVWINEAQSSDTYYVRQYLDFVDITGCDIYPVKKDKRQLERIGQGTERWLKVGRGKPVYMVLQAFSWSELGDYYGEKETVYPAFEESRFMAYNAIVRGANGILYWGSQFLKSKVFRESLYALTSELGNLQPFLVTPALPVHITLTDLPEAPGATQVYATLRKHEQEWLLIVVNEDNVRHMGVVLENLEALNGRELHLLYEESSQAVSHGEVIVRMQPYDTQVYCTSRDYETSRRAGREFERQEGEGE